MYSIISLSVGQSPNDKTAALVVETGTAEGRQGHDTDSRNLVLRGQSLRELQRSAQGGMAQVVPPEGRGRKPLVRASVNSVPQPFPYFNRNFQGGTRK